MKYFYFLIGLFLCLDVSGQITYTVNTVDDVDDGVCDGVHCSLREAISASNMDGVESDINFGISGVGPHEIMLQNSLQINENSTNINGQTQVGNASMDGQIIINAQNSGGTVLDIYSDNTSVSNIHFIGQNILGYWNTSTKGHVIQNNYFSGYYDGAILKYGTGVNFSSVEGSNINGNYFFNSSYLNGQGEPNEYYDPFMSFGIGSEGENWIWNNYFGIQSDGIVTGGQTGCNFGGTNVIISDNEFHQLNTAATGIRIVGNDFYCNQEPIGYYVNEECIDPSSLATYGVPKPTISGYAGDKIVGSIETHEFDIPDLVEITVYLMDDSNCSNTMCQGIAIGYGNLDYNSLVWEANLTISLEEDQKITALAIGGKLNGFSCMSSSTMRYIGTSKFATCFTIPNQPCSNNSSTKVEVTNINDSGDGSLRNAINCANQSADLDSIVFNLPGNGPFLFDIQSDLPDLLDDRIIIDGTTQSGYTDASYLDIQKGLDIGANSCQIYGLSLGTVIVRGNNNQIGKPNKGNIIDATSSGTVFYHSINLLGGNNIIQSNYVSSITIGDVPAINAYTDIYTGVGSGDNSDYDYLPTYVSSGNIIGGQRSLNEGNTIGGRINVYVYGRLSINIPFLSVKGNDMSGFYIDGWCDIPFGTSSSYPIIEVGGNLDESNKINTNAVFELACPNGNSGASGSGIGINLIHNSNDIYCYEGIVGDTFNYNSYYNIYSLSTTLPIIKTIQPTRVNGTSLANSIVSVYVDDNSSCTDTTLQTKIALGSATSDASGNWSVTLADYCIGIDDDIIATTTSENKTSDFVFGIILPGDCKYAEVLPMNRQPCTSIGAVLDLKELATSTPEPTSSCIGTFAGNDAWYRVVIPESGNFLVRTNITNTVVPIIELYTSCDDPALPECMILDSLPYMMIFENYTPNDTLLLRVWDKDNAIVNSENSALLHLTAHELPLLKSDWEICDYENLISDNPTNLVRREANNFILSYDKNTPQSEIEQNNAVFTGMMEMELEKECACGGVPLQLWSTGNPVVLDGRKRYAKSRGSVDTTNYNYIFETVEFQVNSYAIGQQYETDIAMNAEGDFVMVWKDEQRRHNYGRVYLSSGNPVSVEFSIGHSEKNQYNSSVEMLDNGDFIAVWHETDYTTGINFSVQGRMYDADGSPKSSVFNISDSSAITYTNIDTIKQKIVRNIASKGTNPEIAVNSDGSFIVTWQAGSSIFAQRYAANAGLIGKMMEVGNTVDSDINLLPNIAANSNGQFIITWTGEDSDGKGVYAQRFSLIGAPLENAFLVNSTENSTQCTPDVTLLDDGTFIIVWESFEQFGTDSNYDIYAQRFDANTNKLGNEFLVNSYTTDVQRSPSISVFDNGNFLIAWSSLGQDGYAEGIYAKLFDANGIAIVPEFDDSDKGSVGEEFRMNAYNDPQQDKPQTATNGQNIFMGAWEDGANDGSYKGIFAQRYETIELNNTRIFYPIGTATPSTLMGDELIYPTITYNPGTSVKTAKVAILDTGIDHAHSLIQNAIWQNPEVNDEDNCLIGDDIGYDFVNRTGTPIDLDGHGTQVSGILTRDFDSEVKLELMNLKFHELEKGNVFDAICGIYYAVDNGANIINLSWGFEASEEPAILRKALQYASDKDVLIVTTAGNTSKNNDIINKYPANLDIPNMIVVTAYQYKNSTGEIKLANYASHGKNKVDIAAYGYVETAKRGGQKALAAGTSLAAPAVARTAATIKGLYPVLTAAEIKDCILSTVEAVASLTNKVATGGILDHDAALACAQTKAEMITNNACSISGLTINANPTGVCNVTEGAIDLSFSGNDPNPKFLWSTGDTTQNLNNLSAGIYSVTVTDNARCERILDVTITNDCESNCQTNLVMNGIEMNGGVYRSDNTITSSGTIEVDSNVVFKATESITLNTGFHAKAGSEFLATIEDCSNNLNESVAESRTDLSIKEPSKIRAKVYPNPTMNLLNIEVTKPEQGFNLELYDVVGKQLNTWQTTQNKLQISVEHLTAGIYFLRIDNTIVKKFVVGKK